MFAPEGGRLFNLRSTRNSSPSVRCGGQVPLCCDTIAGRCSHESPRPMSFLPPLVTTTLLLAGPPSPLESLGRFDPKAIPEASGIVKSRRHPGIFWVHNDSGNPSILFAIRRDGTIVRKVPLAVVNVDWEDIAADDQGHLYVGDIGNNGGSLAVRMIYRIDEPDPSKPVVHSLPASAATFYKLARSDRFDAEGLFIDRNSAVLVSKRFDGREAELYTVPLEPPAPLLNPADPVKIGTLPRFVEPATGASLSVDHRLLAVCSTTVVRVYQRGRERPWDLIAEAAHDRQSIEGISWDGGDLLLVSEGGGVYRIPEASWKYRATPSGPSATSRPENRRGEAQYQGRD